LKWFEDFRSTNKFESLEERPIAYFCAEYALDQKIKTYSGGLGILAGDLIREVSDRQIPMVGIGLYYHHGYICGTKNVGGEIVEVCEMTPPETVGLEPVNDKDGNRIIIKVPIQDREVLVQAWKWQSDGVPVYLMDSNVSGNNSADCIITHRLYIAEKEIRLKQEIILGIGGLRLLEALDIHPSVYHLNEGHSAMLTLELVRHEMEERKLGFDEAKQFAKRRVVFTNHTLIPAGNEVYSNDLVALLLAKYAAGFGVPVSKLIDLGLVQQSSTFSMTMLSLRMAGIINGVSKLHVKKAKDIWADHPMVAVTNGVHVPTWDQVKEDSSEKGSIWSIHQKNKSKLLRYLKDKTGRQWGENDLLLGWARRIVEYKRPLAVLQDIEGFKKVARNARQPVRIIFAGQPHPSDEEGIRMVSVIRELSNNDLGDIVVYLPDYDMELAKLLVSGCDVWLNTPVVGFEASGTSGMKAALNGVLQCTTKDGWVDEADMQNAGWIIDSEKISADFLKALEKDIIPLYSNRDSSDVPESWEDHMRAARSMALNQFSATRMLREYLEMLYF